MIATVALIGLTSCDKNEQVQQLEPITTAFTYVNPIAGQIVAADVFDMAKSSENHEWGDQENSSDDEGGFGVSQHMSHFDAGNRMWYLYKKVGTSWELVNGTEFIPGSDAALYWADHNNNPKTLEHTSPLDVTYFPDMDLKVVYKTLALGDVDPIPGFPAAISTADHDLYMGVLEFHPTNNFTISMKGRQLRDVLYVDVNAIHDIPNFRFKVTVSYIAQNINFLGTALSVSSTSTGWPTYLFETPHTHYSKIIEAGNNQIDLWSHSVPHLGNNYELFDMTGQKVSGIQVKCEIYQNLALKSTATIVPFKTIIKEIPTSEEGTGILLNFSSLNGYRNGQVVPEDIIIGITTVTLDID